MEKNKTVSVRVSGQMNNMLDGLLKGDTHLSKGEIIRNALRNYIKEDYIEIWNKHKNGGIQSEENKED